MALTDLTSAIDNYEKALAADALNPQPNYSLDGQTVSRETWRTNIMQMIVMLNKEVNALYPYIFTTKQVM